LKSGNLKPIFIILLLLITSLILVFKFNKVDPFYSLALRTNDIYFKFNARKINPQVELVVIDEKSVNVFGRWPWNRKILARGLKNLSLAKVVTLDMVFSEPTNLSADEFLAKTIEEMNNVVCGFFVRLRSTQKVSQDIIDIMSDSALMNVPEVVPFPMAKYIEPNILPITQACTLIGTFNTFADKDNILRHYSLGFIYKGDFYPSIGVQALRLALNQDAWISKNGEFFIGKRKVFTDETHSALLNFYSLKEYKKHMISFVDVYKKKVSPEYFKNKIVIVGISEAGVTDIRATPIGQIPGPLLHLTFISNFLNHELLKSYPLLDAILIVSGLLLIGITYKLFETSYVRIIFYLLYSAFLILIGITIYKYTSIRIDLFFPVINIFLLGLIVETYLSLVKSQQAKFLKSAFGAYLSEKLLDVIIKDPSKLRLGGEKREVTVLFSDIRNFTSIAENLSPTTLVEILNQFLTPMTDIILKNNGTLDKYIGDAIMAIWNAPVDVEDHPKKALITAYEMLEELKSVNETFKKKYELQIDIGIGINTGYVVVGNMGSAKRFDYTAIGDTVNLASRLEGLNKVYKTNVIFSEFTYDKVDFSDLPFIPVILDMVKVKGKEQPVKIFTILPKNRKSFEIKKTYEAGLALYQNGSFDKAKEVFSKIKNFPPAEELIKRCEILINNPPEAWDGVFVMTGK